MKKLLLIIVLLSAFQIFNSFIFSQVPEKMSYQAIVRDRTGELVKNQRIRVRIEIKRDSEIGDSVYIETQYANTGENGLISLEIGTGKKIFGSFSSINWAQGPYFISTAIDLTAKTNYNIFAFSQLLSVPYALHAKLADNVSGVATREYVDELNEQIEVLRELLVIRDIDSNTYHIVKIGSQIWMVENLKVTKFNNGEPIPYVTENYEWYNLTTPAYCWYNNDQATYKNPYGALYNWYTVKSGNLCPVGFHVPNYNEVTTLVNYVGLMGGAKLKESGVSHWLPPNAEVTNETGFTALPGGYRFYFGDYLDIGHTGRWWSSQEINNENSSPWALFSEINSIWWFNDYGNLKRLGYSVRCVKDQ